MAGSMEGQRVLVTGASAGIGRATAIACAEAGATVAALARRTDRLTALEVAHGIVPVTGDVGDVQGIGAVVEGAVDRLGGLDALVGSAGIMRPGLVADGAVQDWQDMFDVNVVGLLAVCAAAIPALRASGPGASIVNISSMSGRRVPAPTGGIYAATKHAVHAVSESLRQELQPDGIRVTTISPGFVDTEIFNSLPASGLVERYQRMVDQVGMSPEDVAEAVLHVLTAPPSVTTVELALIPTAQHDAAYRATVVDR